MNLRAENLQGTREGAARERSNGIRSGGGGLGYYFHPRLYPHAPGHPQLDVVLRPTPTGRHYDPEVVCLKVAPADCSVAKLTIRHPWHWAEHYHVVAGLVSVHDRNNKVLEAFTFGGDLQVTSDVERTMCVLTSSAPIIEYTSDPLTHGPTITGILVEEVEALIARRHGSWDRDHDPDEFDDRLAATDPQTLYLACLQALDEQFNHFPHEAEDGLTRRFVHFLHVEIKRLRELGLWPLYVPPLAKLL